MKRILKPTLSKIILTFALLIIFSLLWRMLVMAVLPDTFPFGFPLQFFLAWGPCKPEQNCSEFNNLWFGLDLIFWYMISAWILGRGKKEAK